MKKGTLNALRFQCTFNCSFFERLKTGGYRSKSGMELVQVAILIAIAIAIGLIFKDRIAAFVNKVFGELTTSGF